VVPLAKGGLAHFSRNAGAPAGSWQGPTVVGDRPASAASLLRSSFGLEVVAELTNGELVLTARDESTKQWSRLYPFGAEPQCNPQQDGTWSDPNVVGVTGIQAVLLRTGKVLLFSHLVNDNTVGDARLFDPATGKVTTPPGSADANHMCPALSAFTSGDIWVVGGTDTRKVSVFDPTSEAWRAETPIDPGRWYGTMATLPDGRGFVIGGTRENFSFGWNNNTWQFIVGGKGNPPTAPVPLPSPFCKDMDEMDLYPFVFVLPNGKVLVHSRTTTRFFDPKTQAFDDTMIVGVNAESRSYPGYGSAVLLPLRPDSSPPYRPEMVMMGGGGPGVLDALTPATDTVERLDLGAASPKWKSTTPMKRGRVLTDAVLLPDGSVMVVGGSATGKADAAENPILTPELFDPNQSKWSDLCPMRVPRIYHTSALLLPDARVMVAGRDGYFNPGPYKYAEHRVEIFSPPYLAKGKRPVVSDAPAAVGYGLSFSVKIQDVGGSDVGSAVLMRPGSATHGLNMDQRFVALTIGDRSGGSLGLTAPPDANVAPPGYYMLFLVSKAGVPSVAKFVQLK